MSRKQSLLLNLITTPQSLLGIPNGFSKDPDKYQKIMVTQLAYKSPNSE